MRSPIKTAFLAVALAGAGAGLLGTSHPARADNVTVGVSAGGIAFGYRDGYWDREHRWHRWHNSREAAEWREANREHYYDVRHSHSPGNGWREEHWWETR